MRGTGNLSLAAKQHGRNWDGALPHAHRGSRHSSFLQNGSRDGGCKLYMCAQVHVHTRICTCMRRSTLVLQSKALENRLQLIQRTPQHESTYMHTAICNMPLNLSVFRTRWTRSSLLIPISPVLETYGILFGWGVFCLGNHSKCSGIARNRKL